MFKSQSNSPHPSEIVCTFPKSFNLPTSCRLSDMKSFLRSTLSEAACTLPSGFHPSITSHVCGALS